MHIRNASIHVAINFCEMSMQVAVVLCRIEYMTLIITILHTLDRVLYYQGSSAGWAQISHVRGLGINYCLSLSLSFTVS